MNNDLLPGSTLLQILNGSHTEATGSGTTVNAPNTQNPNPTALWRKYTRYADTVMTDWFNEPKLRWQIKRADRSFGIVAAERDKFDMPSTNVKIANDKDARVRLSKTEADGTIITRNYTIVGVDQARGNSGAVAFYGGQIVFGVPFEADDEMIGAAILVPIYIPPTPITETTSGDHIPECPNPNYVKYGICSKIASNDLFNRERARSFDIKQAKAMEAMIRDNNAAPGRRVSYGPPPLGNTTAY